MAKKNINIKNWGKSIGKWFGGGSKNSGPPPNMSTYANINSGNFSNGQRVNLIDRFKKGSTGKYIINPNGSLIFHKKELMK